MTEVDRVPPSLRSDAARNRKRLLAAARVRLAEGDRNLGMNALARSAGVGVGTAYRHFPDRQSLLEGLAADAMEGLVAAAQQAAAEVEPALGLERLLAAALEAMAADPVLADVLEAPVPVCVETVGLSRQLGGAMQNLMGRAAQAGLLRPGLTPDDVRRLLTGVHHAAQAGDDPSAARTRYLTVLLAGLKADTTT